MRGAVAVSTPVHIETAGSILPRKRRPPTAPLLDVGVAASGPDHLPALVACPLTGVGLPHPDRSDVGDGPARVRLIVVWIQVWGPGQGLWETLEGVGVSSGLPTVSVPLWLRGLQMVLGFQCVGL